MKKSVSISLIVVLLILIGALGFFSYKLIFDEKKVLVPDFTDKTREEILTWCNGFENSPCKFDNDYSDTIPEGKLIYQSISADEELGDEISFIISLGKKMELVLPTLNEKTTKETIENWIKENSVVNPVEYTEIFDDEVEKGIVVKISPATITNTTDKISVTISKGADETKKEETKTGDIEVLGGKYVGLTEEKFIAKAKELKLTPNHKESKDAYSADIEKGKIVWHGSGDYVKDEIFNYGLSLGSDGESIVVKKGDYVGKSLDEFKKICEELGLVPEHSEKFADDYSTTIEKGNLDWHGEGTYVKGEVIHYTLSLGPKDGKQEGPFEIAAGQYYGKTLEEFTKLMNNLCLKVEHSEARKDDFSDKYEKGTITWHGAADDFMPGETIHYTISLGKKDAGGSSDTGYVHIDLGTYVGYTYADFEKAVKALGVNPRHRTEWDDYSSTIPKGNIIKNGTGDYKKNDASDPISYGLSLGPKEDVKTVNVVSYAGKSETDFKSYLSNSNLKAGTRTESYSDTVNSGLLISNDTGTKDEGSYINYVVSKGKEPEATASIMKASKYQNYQVENSYSGTVNNLQNGPFASFANVTYEGFKEDNPSHTTGIIKEILVNDSSSYTEGDYPTKTTKVKIVIYNN